MIIEPAATASEQITGNSWRTATTAARPLILFLCAKRHPATPIRKLRLAPSSSAVSVYQQALGGYRPIRACPFAAFLSQFHPRPRHALLCLRSPQGRVWPAGSIQTSPVSRPLDFPRRSCPGFPSPQPRPSGNGRGCVLGSVGFIGSLSRPRPDGSWRRSFDRSCRRAWRCV